MPDSTESASQRAAATSDAPWTTRRLLTWMSDHFKTKGVDSPRVTGEMLLSHVIGCERMRLYMEVDRPASAPELDRLRELVARAAKHEPVQYLTGTAWFFGREFEVTRSTLIPRPCTETLVEEVLSQTSKRPNIQTSKGLDGGAQGSGNEPGAGGPDLEHQDAEPAGMDVWTFGRLDVSPLIADIGTGSGCIAITLALQIKGARIVATDIVPEALELAKRNAERHGVAERIEFIVGDGLDALERSRFADRSFDAVCANPPYISDAEWETEVDRNVKDYEPASALRGGADGLDVIRPLIAGAGKRLAHGGGLFIEIGYQQRELVLELVAQVKDLTDVSVVKDHEGLWRVLTARRT